MKRLAAHINDSHLEILRKTRGKVTVKNHITGFTSTKSIHKSFFGEFVKTNNRRFYID